MKCFLSFRAKSFGVSSNGVQFTGENLTTWDPGAGLSYLNISIHFHPLGLGPRELWDPGCQFSRFLKMPAFFLKQ